MKIEQKKLLFSQHQQPVIACTSCAIKQEWNCVDCNKPYVGDYVEVYPGMPACDDCVLKQVDRSTGQVYNYRHEIEPSDLSDAYRAIMARATIKRNVKRQRLVPVDPVVWGHKPGTLYLSPNKKQ